MKQRYKLFLMLIFLLIVPLSVQAEETMQRVMITFNDQIDHSILEGKTIEVHHIFEDYHAVSATIPASLKEELLTYPTIRLIEDDPVVKTNAQVSNTGLDLLNIQESRRMGLTGKGVKIGIIDTGIRPDHPDLHLAGGKSFVAGSPSYFDDQGHGTHVAGIIAAQDNGIGIVGVAPDAEIYAIKALNNKGEGNHSDIIAGINWAIEQKLDIINLSVTSPEGSSVLEATLQNAYAQGILVVAAAGNTDHPLLDNADVLFPARYSTVVAVGSVDSMLRRSLFSYIGPDLDFVAPGEEIYSTFNGSKGEDYMYSSGTSMAAPFVTGIAALYKQEYPMLNNAGIKTHMSLAAEDLGAPGKDILHGYGLVQPPSSESPALFSDVKADSWYSDEVFYLYKKGILFGYDDGGFHPYDPVTRAEAVAMLGRALKMPNEKSETNFSDVPYSSFASGYIKRATDGEIISGYTDRNFKPHDKIIRGDVAFILQNAFKFPNVEDSYFLDVESGQHYYNAVNSLASQNITIGFDDKTFRPNLNITRAEFSVFLAKSMDDSFH